MVQAVDLRAEMNFVKEGKLIGVIESDHYKPGKGNSLMQLRLYDIRSRSTDQTIYRPSEKIELAMMEDRPDQYLYTH